jgi:hypothetical protein
MEIPDDMRIGGWIVKTKMWVAGLCVLFSLASVCWPQGVSSSVNGVLLDPSGSGVAAASCKLANQGTGADHHCGATAAVHSPHGVQEEDEKSPERDEFKAPLAELVVAGRRLTAARTDGSRAFARTHRYFDTLAIRAEAGTIIDKSPEAMAAV